jgi:ribosomal protein S27AE
MPQPSYAYCPNPGCSHRQGQAGVEWEQRPHAVLAEAGAAPGQSCPHCGTELRTTCPKCGKILADTPQCFCPACGASLFQVEAVQPCRVCGRPVVVSALACKEVPVCSERCLRDLIRQHVKICDQCGARFMPAPLMQEAQDGLQPSPGPGAQAANAQGDFCSDACRAKFLAEHKDR